MIEETNGVHSQERTQTKQTKSVAERYAEHCKLNSPFCASNQIIDTNKRGKAADVTDGKSFILEEPVMEE